MNIMESLRRSTLISSFLSGSLSGFSESGSFGDCLFELLHVVLKYLTLSRFEEKLSMLMLLRNSTDCIA